VAIFALLAEGVAVAFFSPRLWVRRVVVSGNHTIGIKTVQKRLALPPQTNLLLVPTEKLMASVKKEPAIETVRIHRIPPELLK
jgi:cell division septal protein FtsQ